MTCGEAGRPISQWGWSEGLRREEPRWLPQPGPSLPRTDILHQCGKGVTANDPMLIHCH